MSLQGGPILEGWLNVYPVEDIGAQQGSRRSDDRKQHSRIGRVAETDAEISGKFPESEAGKCFFPQSNKILQQPFNPEYLEENAGIEAPPFPPGGGFFLLARQFLFYQAEEPGVSKSYLRFSMHVYIK